MVAAIITALVIAGYAYARGGVLYNPGPLNAQSGEMLGGVTSHAETGGNCKACHTAPWEAAKMEDRCVACHGEIAMQMKDVATLHGSLLTGQPDLRCRFCHPEHRGPDASLTELNGISFPHEAVGFSLKGHQFKVTREAFVCSDCHADDISRFDPQTCDTCHRQMDLGFMTGHVLSFGSACLNCHDGVDSLVTGFNHNNFAFKLTGRHGGVTCVKILPPRLRIVTPAITLTSRTRGALAEIALSVTRRMAGRLPNSTTTWRRSNSKGNMRMCAVSSAT
jgi:hypothetical protein